MREQVGALPAAPPLAGTCCCAVAAVRPVPRGDRPVCLRDRLSAHRLSPAPGPEAALLHPVGRLVCVQAVLEPAQFKNQPVISLCKARAVSITGGWGTPRTRMVL